VRQGSVIRFRPEPTPTKDGFQQVPGCRPAPCAWSIHCRQIIRVDSPIVSIEGRKSIVGPQECAFATFSLKVPQYSQGRGAPKSSKETKPSSSLPSWALPTLPSWATLYRCKTANARQVNKLPSSSPSVFQYSPSVFQYSPSVFQYSPSNDRAKRRQSALLCSVWLAEGAQLAWRKPQADSRSAGISRSL
jgi:hypothetical protein